MEKFVINPEKYKQEYIKNLNTCFGHWGGEEEYEWGFERQIGKHHTDIMLIENKEDGVIAGSAVSYRKLSKEGDFFDIGIMTGSWTLPAARRKGCFSKIIDCSKSLCKENEVLYLTAFVTETNASSRRLESAGSHMLPTFHLFSPQEKYEINNIEFPEIEILEQTDELHGQLYQRLQETQKSFLNFKYSPEETFFILKIL